ncbi:hypothetical protein, partial [Streptosporangium sandarakinum]|uniref:hypothetical protein n=1 Tax=Streptosporangium sandarakinum TaxID=1260955 RepID=UPI0033A7A6D7
SPGRFVRFVVPLFFQTGFFVSNRSFGATFFDLTNPKGIRAPRFRDNPSNLLQHPIHVESSAAGTQGSQRMDQVVGWL